MIIIIIMFSHGASYLMDTRMHSTVEAHVHRPSRRSASGNAVSRCALRKVHTKSHLNSLTKGFGLQRGNCTNCQVCRAGICRQGYLLTGPPLLQILETLPRVVLGS